MKRKYWVCGLTLLALAGCSSNQKQAETTHHISAKTSQKETQKTAATSAEKEKTSATEDEKLAYQPVSDEKALWNRTKADQLQQFMASWGQTMGQKYYEYDPQHNVDYYGVKVPEQLLDSSVSLEVNGEKVEPHWSIDGGKSGVNLVAVYSDLDASGDDDHCYLFTIKDDQPQVLIGEQTENQTMRVKETANVELKNGFQQIIAGQASSGQNSAQTQAAGNDVHHEENQAGHKEQEQTQASGALAGYSAEQVQAAKVWSTVLRPVTGDVESMLKFYIHHNPAGAPVGINDGTVGYPEETITISATPTAAGGVTYADNGDGTVTVYPVPLHFQDLRFNDPEFTREFTQEIIDNAQIVPVQNFSDEELLGFLTRVE